VAKILGETSLMFLVHPTLGDQHIQTTCQVVKNVMIKATKQHAVPSRVISASACAQAGA
jgi:hypothetical protein